MLLDLWTHAVYHHDALMGSAKKKRELGFRFFVVDFERHLKHARRAERHGGHS
jgi:hypothetical protein